MASGKTSNISTLLKTHWLAIVIILAGSFLRLTKLDTHGILFGDSGRDVLVAIESVENKELPLLGIPSSVPRFKQGPLSIWMVMALYPIVGKNFHAFSLFFALWGIFSLFFTYYLATKWFSKQAGLIAVTLLAFSPLAIAHSRMVYHTVPIVVTVLLFLWSLEKMWRGKKYSYFLAAFSFAMVFQFELSLFPFLLAIPFVLFRSKQKLTWNMIGLFVSGIFLGLLPQIIFDLTNKFAQLGQFGLWLGYRVVTAFIPSEHSFSTNKLSTTIESFHRYFWRMWTIEHSIIFLITAVLLFISLIQVLRILFKHTLTPPAEILITLSGLLTIGYFVHGSPSEAYFPAYFVLIPLVIGYGISSIGKKTSYAVLSILIFTGLINAKSIYDISFFVSQDSPFNYGPSISEQKEIVEYIANTSNNHFYLESEDEGSTFPAYLDHLRYLVKEMGYSENHTSGSPFVVYTDRDVSKNFGQVHAQEEIVKEFTTTKVVHIDHD